MHVWYIVLQFRKFYGECHVCTLYMIIIYLYIFVFVNELNSARVKNDFSHYFLTFCVCLRGW